MLWSSSSVLRGQLVSCRNCKPGGISLLQTIHIFHFLCSVISQLKTKTPHSAPGAVRIFMARGCIPCALTLAVERTCTGGEGSKAGRSRCRPSEGHCSACCEPCARAAEPGLLLCVFNYSPSYTASTAVKASMTVARYGLPTVSDTCGDLAYKVPSQSPFLLWSQIP